MVSPHVIRRGGHVLRLVPGFLRSARAALLLVECLASSQGCGLVLNQVPHPGRHPFPTHQPVTPIPDLENRANHSWSLAGQSA